LVLQEIIFGCKVWHYETACLHIRREMQPGVVLQE